MYDAEDSQVLALVVRPDGTVLAGTGPSGQLIDLTDPKHPATRPDPKVQYIWDLGADKDGNVYAATGPAGQLWKLQGKDRWSLVYDSKATHLLCVAIAPDGRVYAGSDGEGLIFAIGRDGKATVLFDAPQSEIRTLAVGGDGALRRDRRRGRQHGREPELPVHGARRRDAPRRSGFGRAYRDGVPPGDPANPFRCGVKAATVGPDRRWIGGAEAGHSGR